MSNSKSVKKEKALFSIQEINQYLARIRCPLNIQPTLKYLTQLHRQHILNIPFENLDNFLGNQILLDIKKIFDKVMMQRRGGFCYELNGLFYHLLLALGFDAHLLSARVFHEQGRLGPEFDHMAIRVDLEDGSYLLDVGYGESFRSPKKIQPELVQMDFQEYYKIVKDINDIYTLQFSSDALYFDSQYQFTLEERNLVEFLDMCEFHHKNSKSHLVKQMYVHQMTKSGQMILTERQLTIDESGQREKMTIHNRDEFVVKLKQHFGLDFIANS